MIIVSAAVKLIPNPPALVESKNTLHLDVGELKLSISCYLLIVAVSPSSLKTPICFIMR
jgi:hypothetical protein